MGKPLISVRIRLWLSNFLFMKINRNNQDLKTINRNRGSNCLPCVFHSTAHMYYCILFCHFGKIWIKDICNSDIFRL